MRVKCEGFQRERESEGRTLVSVFACVAAEISAQLRGVIYFFVFGYIEILSNNNCYFIDVTVTHIYIYKFATVISSILNFHQYSQRTRYVQL